MQGGLEHTAPPSRRLPPLEAWKSPDKWIDLKTGKVKPGIKKIHLETDDRGFLFPKNVLHQVVETFFHEDFDWPYRRNDPETRPDKHHMHHPRCDYRQDHFDGDIIPAQFRELPTLIGLMPRQLHNAIHDLTEAPALPKRDAMQEYVESYKTAYRIFSELFQTAKRSLALSSRFHLINQGRTIDEELLRTNFTRTFARYSQLVDEFDNLDNREILFSEPIRPHELRGPKGITQRLGKRVVRQSVDLLAELPALATA